MSSEQHPDKPLNDDVDDATTPRPPRPRSVLGEVASCEPGAESLGSGAPLGAELSERRPLAPVQRIGIAKGLFVAPDEDAALDERVAKLLVGKGRETS